MGLHGEEERTATEGHLDTILAQMQEDVLEMHRKLSTGIDEGELNALAEGLTELIALMDDRSAGWMVSRIREGVLSRIQLETGALAWQQLLRRMEQSGAEWPVRSAPSVWWLGRACTKTAADSAEDDAAGLRKDVDPLRTEGHPRCGRHLGNGLSESRLVAVAGDGDPGSRQWDQSQADPSSRPTGCARTLNSFSVKFRS